MTETPKMQHFEEIINIVQQLRIVEKLIEKMQDQIEETRTGEIPHHKAIKNYGISCHEVTNCIDVGIQCYKCKNNLSRRSYFRDLLEKGVEINTIYTASDVSFFDAVEKE